MEAINHEIEQTFFIYIFNAKEIACLSVVIMSLSKSGRGERRGKHSEIKRLAFKVLSDAKKDSIEIV